MASCLGCKRRTTSFCFAHKNSICDDCLAVLPSPSVSSSSSASLSSSLLKCEPNCPIHNYFDWLSDGDYEWPPKCTPLCNKSISADNDSMIRLTCKCMFHRLCLADYLKQRFPNQQFQVSLDPAVLSTLLCPNCQSPVFDPVHQVKTRLRDSVQRFLELTMRISLHSMVGAYIESNETKNNKDIVAHRTGRRAGAGAGDSSIADLESGISSSSSSASSASQGGSDANSAAASAAAESKSKSTRSRFLALQRRTQGRFGLQRMIFLLMFVLLLIAGVVYLNFASSLLLTPNNKPATGGNNPSLT